MPYADPGVKRHYDNTLFLQRYQSDPEFRADEAYRKRIWYYRKQDEILARYRARRKKVKASLKLVKAGKPKHCKDLKHLSLPERVPLLY
jgi:hypothetical protein